MNRAKLLTGCGLTALAMSASPFLLAQQPPPAPVIPAALVSAGPQNSAGEQAAGAQKNLLDQLIAEALANNPSILAAANRVKAFRHRVSQVKALPDPKVTAGWNGDIKPFGTLRSFPPSSRNFGASQTIPYPGKLKLRGDLAGREVEAAQWDVEAARRRVVAAVKAAYYDYYYTTKALSITSENQKLLEKLAEISEVRYRVGNGLQQDLLKAQTELSKILLRLTIFEQKQRTAQVRLNTLLKRDPETLLPPPDSVEPAELVHSLESLYQLARENDPGLARGQSLIERSQVALNLAGKEHLPDFTVGYTYQNRPTFPDTHNFTFGINIPIFYRSKQREGVREAAEWLSTARRSREARETEVQFAVKRHYLTARASHELLQLYSQAITPQSSLALESSLTAYQVGRIGFLAVIDNFRTVLDAELDYYRELASYQTALARLEPLVGVELTN